MIKYTLLITAFFGLAAVALGAFGAHALKPNLSDYQLTIWEKAVYYQFFHTSALLFMHLWYKQAESASKLIIIYLFIAGIVCFSGSLYLLATKDLTQLPTKLLGPITPLGGLLFLLAWAGLMREAYIVGSKNL